MESIVYGGWKEWQYLEEIMLGKSQVLYFEWCNWCQNHYSSDGLQQYQCWAVGPK
jgi:hypothetical protein